MSDKRTEKVSPSGIGSARRKVAMPSTVRFEIYGEKKTLDQDPYYIAELIQRISPSFVRREQHGKVHSLEARLEVCHVALRTAKG